jgi:hypothetical protein
MKERMRRKRREDPEAMNDADDEEDEDEREKVRCPAKESVEDELALRVRSSGAASFAMVNVVSERRDLLTLRASGAAADTSNHLTTVVWQPQFRTLHQSYPVCITTFLTYINSYKTYCQMQGLIFALQYQISLDRPQCASKHPQT